MSKILVDSINEEAERTWNGGAISKNLPEWYKHWIKTGRSLATDYENQLLFETAEFIREYVNETAKSLERFFKEEALEVDFVEARYHGLFKGFDHTLFIKMYATDFEYMDFRVSLHTKPKEWCDWWKSLDKVTRKNIAKQVEMSFGREAYQKQP